METTDLRYNNFIIRLDSLKASIRGMLWQDQISAFGEVTKLLGMDMAVFADIMKDPATKWWLREVLCWDYLRSAGPDEFRLASGGCRSPVSHLAPPLPPSMAERTAG
ncbi:MAG TPA: hypothetical protein VI855_09095 [Dehalococcoidia bacterium]|nr:hypothetical protein [Dehalococcoidia bacterium]